ncbi:MAG: hypothetical protein ABI298_06470 [Acidimicrobiales bacterium]
MKKFVTRSVAAMAILATFSFGTPVIAMGGTTPTTTTTIAPLTLRQYHAENRVYLAELNVINQTFILAVSTAKSNYASTLSVANTSSERISARSTFHSAIAHATLTRSNSLSVLGNAPMKPRLKSPRVLG